MYMATGRIVNTRYEEVNYYNVVVYMTCLLIYIFVYNHVLWSPYFTVLIYMTYMYVYMSLYQHIHVHVKVHTHCTSMIAV